MINAIPPKAISACHLPKVGTHFFSEKPVGYPNFVLSTNKNISIMMINKQTHLILHTIARYFLATIFLMYAFAKILGTQFTSQPQVWDKTIGQLSGFELTWFYFGYSYGYGIFIASTQIIASGLLFFRKTTRVGIVLYLSIITNILVLDFAYNIEGAKGMAIILTGLALFVLLSEFKGFYEFFIQKPALFKQEDNPKWLNKIRVSKFILIPLVFIGLFTFTFVLKNKYMSKNEFFGAWKVAQLKGKSGWNRIYFQSANTFSIRSGQNFQEIYSGKYKFDKASQTIWLQAFKTNDKNIDVLSVQEGQMYDLLKAKYQITEKELLLNGEGVNIKMEKVR
ncbi:hypothetical protein BKI52_04100 [marine bacterium AO1-C]|nr:hypothetical protein BKI52_04100 [marine bacterium AO1-C]